MPPATQKVTAQQKRIPRPYTVLVAFKASVDSRTADSMEQQLGLYEDTTLRSPYFHRCFISQSAELRGMTVERAIRALQSSPSVTRAEPDMPVYPDQVNDPQFPSQWSLNNTGQTGGTPGADVHAVQAWPNIPSVSPVTVAVLDDGVEVAHPDLNANIAINPGEIPNDGIDNDNNGFIDDVYGWNFAENNNNPTPPSGNYFHGTHVAGIIAAVSNNGIGIASASRNVKILPVRFYRGQPTYISDLILAADYARIRGAKVVNISFDLDSWTQLLVDAFNRLASADAAVVLSAGNTSTLNPQRLAMMNLSPNLCFVASTDANDNLSSFSNYGPGIQVAAPGENIFSTMPYGSYGTLSGTSMAAPMASGILGTVRAMYPSLTYAQAISRLENSCDFKNSLIGKVRFGRVNLANAIQADSIAPAAVTGLTLVRRSTGTFLIQFNASGDDGTTGAANFYDVRYSLSPITASNFNSAGQCLFRVATPPAGTPVRCSIGGLVPGQTYYLAVKAFDKVGNESPITTAGPFTLVTPTAYDDMEGVTSMFTPTGAWARTTEAAYSGVQSWSDSPGGDYANNTNSTLTYNYPVAVTGPMAASFMMRYDLENGYDFLKFEASTDGGSTWTVLNAVTGTSGQAFQSFSIPLNAYIGQTLLLRFHFTSDASITADGVHIDDFGLQTLTTTFFDNVEGTPTFDPGTSTWAISSLNSFSPTHSWNSNPGTTYANNTNQLLKGTVDLDCDAVGSPLAAFKGLINTEPGKDFISVLTSSDSGATWIPRSRFSGWGSTFAPYYVPMGVLGPTRLAFQLTSDMSVTGNGASIDDIGIVGEPWTQQVSGTVNLNGFNGTKNFTVKLRSGTTIVQTNTVPMTGPVGSFQFNTGLYGPYDVVIEGPSFLRRVVPGVNVTAFTSLATNLVNGDINGDNIIGVGDFNALRAAWGATSSSTNWNANADLDGNGVVGTADFSILRSNWGAIGDN